MTISELRRTFQSHIDSQGIISMGPARKDQWVIICSPQNHQVAKYACTTEENEFKLVGGKVFFKGFEIKPAIQ